MSSFGFTVFKSMRVQLTLWYTGVLALMLIVFAVSLYLYLARATRQRTDEALLDTANSFISNFTIELNDEKHIAGEAANEVIRSFRYRDQQAIVYDQQGRIVVASTNLEGLPQPNDWFTLPPVKGQLLNSSPNSGRSYATLFSGDNAVRTVAVMLPAGAENYTLVIATPLRSQEQALESARGAFLVAIPAVLLLAGLSGYFLARKSLAPIVIMGKQAARIGASNLNERMPVPRNNNELGNLAVSFNDLLARLDESFAQQKRFMADASHELRTPVAVVCGESEVALSQPTRGAQEYRESLGIVNDEGLRMTRMVEDLFTLARADTGEYPLSLADFYLDESVNECVRSLRSLASQSDLEISYQPPAKEIALRGDELLVQRMIFNLLHNAIKYTPKGGRVCVCLKESERHCEIIISDTGPGIPREAQAHVFDRFFRVDKARSRGESLNGSGAGLGLSIAKWVAELHGGTITLNSPNGSGATFVVTLPKQPH